ncbi:DNA polymerase III subunit theta [Serratia quinivorans]|uniref:DNA polymerase III subunit theta n=1 Tax=Serratia quinivorans TaxID=137545 RepID=A0A380ASK1_9GAMM|nr:DNA polymerase III subunit theta [Serratia proteamaculans]RYM60017.1 DNA polymerase III subunit theta [Serratia proteamaculans]SUI86297.1 DNA polymerase III subunit theta [Serratia quinivorans]
MTKSFNLANLSKEDMDKTNVDLAASGVAYKERINMPIVPAQVEAVQPEHLRELFRERLQHYHSQSHKFPAPGDPRYQQMAESNGKS